VVVENMHMAREKFVVQHKIKAMMPNLLNIQEGQTVEICPRVICPAARSLVYKSGQTRQRRRNSRARFQIAIPQFFELVRVRITETGKDLSSFGCMVNDNSFRPVW